MPSPRAKLQKAIRQAWYYLFPYQNFTFLQGAESLRAALRAVFLSETTALRPSGSPQNLALQYVNNWLGRSQDIRGSRGEQTARSTFRYSKEAEEVQ